MRSRLQRQLLQFTELVSSGHHVKQRQSRDGQQHCPREPLLARLLYTDDHRQNHTQSGDDQASPYLEK
jgi:hypothetical protein